VVCSAGRDGIGGAVIAVKACEDIGGDGGVDVVFGVFTDGAAAVLVDAGTVPAAIPG
jgi:hypothetical protein